MQDSPELASARREGRDAGPLAGLLAVLALAVLALTGALLAIVPGAWQLLADAPLAGWLLAALALILAWPRDDG